jgi:hypothetical protein
MTVIIGGSGTANGISSFSSPATFGSTISATGSISQGSAAPFNLVSGQLAFPATQNASSDANTLDDYEEGTWTPVVTASSGTITSYTSSGFYTKIGRFMHISGQITITNPGTATNQYIVFSGLPYASSPSFYANIGACRENAVNGYLNQVIVNQGATTGSILKYDNTGNIVTNGAFYFTVTYFTA